MYVLDIQWLLLMETLNPREHAFQSQMEFPFRKNLGTNFIRTIPSSRQDLGSLDEIGGWHCRSGII